MKYYVSASPGPMPPAPELFDAAESWLEARVNDGTFDCVYGFMEGGGFAIANADSNRAAYELMLEYPLFGMVTWTVRPVLEFREGSELVRAKLVEAQAAMAGH
jgi:hypothetical protein